MRWYNGIFFDMAVWNLVEELDTDVREYHQRSWKLGGNEQYLKVLQSGDSGSNNIV